ncbi:intermembrane phospholipid transport protein YdbH family protein [Sphingomonas sp. CCH18-B1]|uniref:intermembrane phospholipid transport protein YdbH family protein n=2 Tax=Sphingomonadales TaxID=204457 RepID=UPI00082B8D61|nr:YdbH domain-containing protein [Sphingomonas sp. CCH18-B1]
MSDPDTEAEAIPPERQVRAWRRMAWPLRVALYGVALLGLAGLVAWTQREDIARNLIGNELEARGIEARYDIESIGVGRQTVRNLVLGDPKRPDATIARLSVDVSGGLFGLRIDQVIVEGLRGYGRLDKGRVSFGSLDKLLYTDSKEPFRLPRLDLTLRDARVRIESPYGTIGVKADGRGNLRDGFKGQVAAIGAGLAYQGCALDRPSLFGTVSIADERPAFRGPMRFSGLACDRGGVAVGQSSLALRAEANAALDRVEGALIPAVGAIRADGFAANGLGGRLGFVIKGQQIDGDVDLALADPATAGIGFRRFGARGKAVVRLGGASPDLRFEGDLRGESLAVARERLAGLDSAVKASANLPIAPLVQRMVSAARRALPGSDLAMTVDARARGAETAFAIPRLSLSGARGERLVGGNSLSVRRVGEEWQLAGNLATGGAGLPVAQLRIVPRGQGAYALKLAMDAYSAGDASLTLPQFEALWNGRGELDFAGSARLSGPFPGGRVEGLALPLQGRWSEAGGFAMYDACQTVRVERLRVSNFASGRQALTLCPDRGRSIVRSGPGGLQMAARLAGPTRLQGKLGSSDLALAAGAVRIDFPGSARLSDVDLLIGPAQSGTHITAGDFSVDLGGALGGTYADAEATIGAVPLVLTHGAGRWSFANAILDVQGDEWLLRDRQAPAGFQPLITDDMRLTLADGRIAVTGILDEPQTLRPVVRVAIAHDLASVTGHADLSVDALTFDDRLQPEMVSNIALGIIANTRGLVTGQGRIDWSSTGVTSSTGRFRTDSLDFAAAFGPVTGLAGEIVFTDLLGFETGPGQVVRLAQVNPGFAVYNGLIRYQILPGFKMRVEGGEWPFAGGRLLLDPGMVDLVSEEPRRLVFLVDRVDAAQFLAGFDFENINATGQFTGVIPIVFDKDGGHVRGGRLEVIGDGGTLAYVGELTYEDLGTMANFAFNALRSLRYRYLVVEMDGDLAGEVITKIRFDGLSQGEGASRNFLTRQVEKLPLQFNVTIAAPFLQLITSARSLYDTQYITDPGVLGLLPGQVNNPGPNSTTPAKPGIQPPESEDRP